MALKILKQRGEVGAARAEMRRDGIDCADSKLTLLLKRVRLVKGVPLGDWIKSWDVQHTVRFIREHLQPGDAILDLGAYSSETLPALKRIGHTCLTGIDLNPGVLEMPAGDWIRYRVGNFYESGLPEASLSAITAISVIEHGFDGKRLLSEVSRLLKPGGYFIASVDYWASKIATDGIEVFGLNWMIFSRDELEDLFSEAAKYQLVPVGDLDFLTDQAPIRWCGKSYTFAWFVLRKEAPAE